MIISVILALTLTSANTLSFPQISKWYSHSTITSSWCPFKRMNVQCIGLILIASLTSLKTHQNVFYLTSWPQKRCWLYQLQLLHRIHMRYAPRSYDYAWTIDDYEGCYKAFLIIYFYLSSEYQAHLVSQDFRFRYLHHIHRQLISSGSATFLFLFEDPSQTAFARLSRSACSELARDVADVYSILHPKLFGASWNWKARLSL